MTRTILMNGKFATLDPARPRATAVAIRDGVFEAVGSDDEVMRLADADTKVINLEKRTAIPGLNDSHTHVIRGGLHYNMELRWEGVPSLEDALAMLTLLRSELVGLPDGLLAPLWDAGFPARMAELTGDDSAAAARALACVDEVVRRVEAML